MPEIQLTLRNEVGLHARPAALFVQTAQKYQSEIRVAKGGEEGNAKSFKAVLKLGVYKNDEITVRADGPDADNALAALAQLVADNFGEK